MFIFIHIIKLWTVISWVIYIINSRKVQLSTKVQSYTWCIRSEYYIKISITHIIKQPLDQQLYNECILVKMNLFNCFIFINSIGYFYDIRFPSYIKRVQFLPDYERKSTNLLYYCVYQSIYVCMFVIG